jgi:hypothetical protein
VFKLYFQNVKGALSAKIVIFVTHKNKLSKGIRHPDNNEDHVKDDKRRDEERNCQQDTNF